MNHDKEGRAITKSKSNKKVLWEKKRQKDPIAMWAQQRIQIVVQL